MKKVRKKKSSPNKKVKNATPLVYDEISFKSRLEVYCYKKLKENKINVEYEKHRYTISDAFEYNDETVRKITYTPDFVGDVFIIECKGHMNETFPLRWKLFKHYLKRNNINYNLYLPRNQKDVDKVVEDIKKNKNE